MGALNWNDLVIFPLTFMCGLSTLWGALTISLLTVVGLLSISPVLLLLASCKGAEV